VAHADLQLISLSWILAFAFLKTWFKVHAPQRLPLVPCVQIPAYLYDRASSEEYAEDRSFTLAPIYLTKLWSALKLLIGTWPRSLQGEFISALMRQLGSVRSPFLDGTLWHRDDFIMSWHKISFKTMAGGDRLVSIKLYIALFVSLAGRTLSTAIHWLCYILIKVPMHRPRQRLLWYQNSI
jgi:hypothetical protein